VGVRLGYTVVRGEGNGRGSSLTPLTLGNGAMITMRRNINGDCVGKATDAQATTFRLVRLSVLFIVFIYVRNWASVFD
jgi:hypothetical protein